MSADLLRWGYLPPPVPKEPEWPEVVDMDTDEAVDGLDAVLSSSVSRALAEVPDPIGIGLSGGLDSSLLAYYASRRGHEIHCVHVEVGKGEQEYADFVAQRINPARYLPIDAPFAGEKGTALQLVYTSDPAAFATQKLCRTLADGGCSSMMTGLGADEMLSSYGRHLRHIGKPLATYYHEHEVWTEGEIAEMLPGQTSTPYPSCSARDQIVAVGWLDLVTYGAACVEMTEAIALDAGIKHFAHPFCDPEVVRFLATVPAELKLPGGGKYLERVLAHRVFGNREFAWRPKAGFGGAMMPWLLDHMSIIIDATIRFQPHVHRPTTPMEAKRLWTLYVWSLCYGR